MINQRKKRNTLYSTLLLFFGLALSLVSILFLYNSTKAVEEKESALLAKEDVCKSFAISQGYSMKETKNNVFFEKKNIRPEKYMFQLLEVNSVFLKCSSLSLEKACIGESCELSKNDTSNNLENHINVSITLGK